MRQMLRYFLIGLVCVCCATVGVHAAPLPIADSPVLSLVPEGTKNVLPYESSDRYKVKLDWSNSPFPDVTGIDAKFMNVFFREQNKGYQSTQFRKTYKSGLSFEEGGVEVTGLKGGTVYEIDATSQYTVLQNGKTTTSLESATSARLKVLTDISLTATPISTDQIKLVWDDVWLDGKRVDYRLYVSESPSFTVQPLRIYQSTDIGTGKRITVSQAEGKLEYVQTVPKSGSVYYFKIEPIVASANLLLNAGGTATQVSSYIFVTTKKISSNTLGEVWNLEWAPVETGIAGVNVSYNLYRGTEGSLAGFVENTTNTNAQEIVTEEDEGVFYYIKAVVQKNEEDLFPIEIRSPDIYLKEEEVPSDPGLPELSDAIGSVTYEALLSANGATVLWRAPLKGDGSLDLKTKYDIWLLSDPNLIDNPPVSNRLATSYQVPQVNYILEGNTVLGYKYHLAGLTPNAVYYFKIVAKKEYTSLQNGKLVLVEKHSPAALKVIITKPDGRIDIPVYPNQPPFKIKKKDTGEHEITTETITLELKNQWFEYFDESTQKWNYLELPERLAAYDQPAVGNVTFTQIVQSVTTAAEIQGINFRRNDYDAGLSMDIGCEEIGDGMSLEAMKEIMNTSSYKMREVPIVPNDPQEDVSKNYDGKKHRIHTILSGLKPNTLYLIWIKVKRPSNATQSDVSDPIVVATLPETSEEPPNPVVPTFRVVPGDIYVDMISDFLPGYLYRLSIGTEDNREKAILTKNIQIKETEHMLSYRVTELKPGTSYYFWLQATVSKNNSTKFSEWSDAVPVMTDPSRAPETPSGFGQKNVLDAVTPKTLTYEWIKEDGMEYIIEFSGNDEFIDARLIDVKSVSEYTLQNLRPNTRYWARLYAFDPIKKLRSQATAVVSLKTGKNNEEYENSEDTENVGNPDNFSEDFNTKEGILTVKITDGAADTLIRNLATDKKDGLKIVLDAYKKNLKKTEIHIAGVVMDALQKYKEELSIYDGKLETILKPGNFENVEENSKINDKTKLQYRIEVMTMNDKKISTAGMKVKEAPFSIAIFVTDGQQENMLQSLENPIRMNVHYSEKKWFTEGETAAFRYQDANAAWQRLPVEGVYDAQERKGIMHFDVQRPGSYVIADAQNEMQREVGYHVYQNEIQRLLSKFPMQHIRQNAVLPAENTTVVEGVRFVLGALKVDYGKDEMPMAFKSGLIAESRLYQPGENLTAREAVHMVLRMYEIKLGIKFTDEGAKQNFYQQHLSQIAPLNDNTLSRGEMLALIEKVLGVAGEMD